MVVPGNLSDGESAQDQVIASWKVLNYLPLDLTLLDNVSPTKEIKILFWENMEFEHMKDEVMTACEMLVVREAEE